MSCCRVQEQEFVSIADTPRSSVTLLTERLATVVKEHYHSLILEDDTEIARLRQEVLQLRNEVERLQKRSLSREAELVASVGAVQPSTGDEPAPALPSPSHKTLLVSSADPSFSKQDSPGAVHVREGSFEGSFKDKTTIRHSCSSGANDTEILDLEERFRELDPEEDGYIDINPIVEHLTADLEGNEKEIQKTKFKSAVHKLNKSLGFVANPDELKRKNIKGQLQLSAYKVLMLEDQSLLQEHFGTTVTNALLQIRQALIQDVIASNIAATWNVSKNRIEVLPDEDKSCRSERTMRILDPVVGFMICLNAIQIGISLDLDTNWNGWLAVEVFFTLFFLFECIISVWIRGVVGHFFGHDWRWSWFDFAIVCTALVDSAITLTAKLAGKQADVALNHLLVLRLARIVRITRLIRIIRLRMFKELTLMVNGVIAGLRTLIWAVVLLGIFMYALGVFMRQVMTDDEDIQNECLKDDKGNYPSTCNRGEQMMTEYGQIMFGTVGRSMLTMFMCFTDGCAAPDGTPLIWHLWDSHGPLLVSVYVAAFLFVSFGVLNLIMAVFVENTLASAQRNDAERQYGEVSAHVQKAHELHVLLGRFCRGAPEDTPKQEKSKAQGLLKKALSMFSSKSDEDDEEPIVQSTPTEAAAISMRITQDQFEDILQDQKVHDLLDDLDVSCISRGQLFDILDADGNGYLAVSELVNGIMRLRGPADKGDGVAAVLMIRQLQKQLGKFEDGVNNRMEVLEGRINKQQVWI